MRCLCEIKSSRSLIGIYRSGSEWRSELGTQSYRAQERGLLKMEKPQNEVPWKGSKREEGILNHCVSGFGVMCFYLRKRHTQINKVITWVTEKELESCEVTGIPGTKELILGGRGTGYLRQRRWIWEAISKH